ncbi:mandelate racemase/muconate lactonizing enzyme family protein [Halonotius roseus]|uniref:o-succinylbenzoate synthase n=1 Tax=Halonotius roseus TaxID=2511997 RepID=A0A544QQL6_9EURY|nr:enolase C-terminal domain-like protein [Halonotius roseus]TQQ81728.1 o-succinylbenzoate synthase [Halonotius roseus]
MWIESFSLALASPLSTARGEITERRGFLVGVDDTAAPPGIGEASPLPGWTESVEACQTALDATDPESTETFPDPSMTPAAAHAVELAGLDRRGRNDSTPLATTLRQDAFDDADAAVPQQVPVNATIGDADIDATVAAAESALADGYDCLKLKAGSQSLEADLQRVRAVREAVDDAVALRIDANGAWDVPTAEDALDEFAALDVAYVEQPLPASNIAGHRELRGRGVDIALDESLSSASISAVLDADAADVVILKPMALGGPLRATQAAARAREAGVEPVVTTTIDAVVARTAAVHVAAAVPEIAPCGLATGSLLADDLAADPVRISEGTASVPTGGGLCGSGFDSLRR